MNYPLPVVAMVLAAALSPAAWACSTPATVCFEPVRSGFPLVEDGVPATVVVDATADSAVRRASIDFARDLGRVSGRDARRVDSRENVEGAVVAIGVLGRSPIVDGLVEAGKLDAGAIAGAWEAFRVVVVDQPWPGVPRALVILGSDRRGAVFGTYDLAERVGVSPWYWFADVPVARRSTVYVRPGAREERPGVRYRGFFINDEDPALSGWAKKRFGGVNADMYEHVFELILRLKGNYLWPAMWAPKAFHLDDPRSRVLADEMGIVMGTSHHEPMTRAQAEWHRTPDDPTTGGAWNYVTNAENLRRFWRGGIERMMSKGDGKGYENLVTIGMRGDGDEPMSEETAIGLLETIVADQRRIIAEVTGKPARETPQVWALYKEVQDYYDAGMTVPDDVTLLFADDNWGQIRRLPAKSPGRPGGYGVYYHFDYVGGPRSYKWLSTVQIGKVWQQMNLAWERGARAVWVVNVGDIKPMEYPLDFFMKMAWAPEDMTPQALARFPPDWGARQFGADLAPEIASLVTTYSRFAARRKPELVNEDAWPIGEVRDEVLVRGEFGTYVDLWRALVAEMEATKARIRPEQGDAFFELVEFPIRALSNLYEMYFAAAWNRRLASLDDVRANSFKKAAEAAFARDGALTRAYHSLLGGKWDGMMSEVHMNYESWNTPERQTLPAVTDVDSDAAGKPADASVAFVPGSGEAPGRIVIEAASFDRNLGRDGLRWTPIPDLGQSEAAMVAMRQGQPATTFDDGIRLEYDVTLAAQGDLHVALQLAPTLDTSDPDGNRIGVSLDDGPVQVLISNLVPTAGAIESPGQQAWTDAVIDNRHDVEGVFEAVAPGPHTFKIWRLDDNVVLERIVLE